MLKDVEAVILARALREDRGGLARVRTQPVSSDSERASAYVDQENSILSLLTRLLKRSSAGSPPNKASDVLWSKAGVSLSVESKRFVELGVGALARGEHAQAQAHWQVAREAPAAHIDAWVLAAQHSTERERVETLLREAIALFPQDPKPVHHLARHYERLGEWGLAERLWREHVRLDDNNWWVFAALAQSLGEQGRQSEAATIIAMGKMRHPGDANLTAETARRLQATDTCDRALEAWRRIIAEFPKQWVGYQGVADTLSYHGRNADADEFIAEHARSFADDPDAVVAWARLSERRRDWSGAETAWRSAVGLLPGRDWVYEGLLNALEQANKRGEAAELASRASMLFPFNPRFCSRPA
jgi:tetratricopeptide (TPR) repeat protein